ncbi:MAG: hypothetical protein LLG02_16745 [Pelosinus sp.]|nr:hypothetical protein [Pelosinus sp.]
MKSIDICPICQKDFRGHPKSSTKLKQHIAKKEDPFHKLLRGHQLRWPAAPYFISMMEIKPQFNKLVEKYGKPKHYTEEHIIHEEDPNLEMADDWDDITGK